MLSPLLKNNIALWQNYHGFQISTTFKDKYVIKGVPKQCSYFYHAGNFVTSYSTRCLLNLDITTNK